MPKHWTEEEVFIRRQLLTVHAPISKLDYTATQELDG